MNARVLHHFQRVDPILYRFALAVRGITPEKSDDYFQSLCREIIGQQLASAAARSIFERFLSLFPRRKVVAKKLLTMPDETLRAVGPSWAKVKFLKDLAGKVERKEIDLGRLDTLSDEAVAQELTQVKGIGPWTAEMFLMFSLGREDVFSFGDLGLRRAIQKMYRLKKEPTRRQMEKITKKWSPYRTYAARILWKTLE